MAVVLRLNRPAGQKRRNGLRPEYRARLAPERLSLLKALASSCSLAAIGGMSFVGELRHWRWRYGARIVLAAMLIALGIIDRP